MDRISYNFIETTLEDVNFKIVNISGEINVENNFKVSVNMEDKSKIKVTGVIALYNGDIGTPFLTVTCAGYFNSNNSKENVELHEFENPVKMLNYVMPEISESVSFITRKAYGHPIEIPTEVPEEMFEQKSKNES